MKHTKTFILIAALALASSGAFAGDFDDTDPILHQMFLERGWIEPTRGEKIDRIYDHVERARQSQQRNSQLEARNNRLEAIVYIWQQMSPEEQAQFNRQWQQLSPKERAQIIRNLQ